MMINAIGSLKSDTEALAVLSGLGFSYKDWPFIKKVSPTNLLASDLMVRFIEHKATAYKELPKILLAMRPWLDRFYEAQGSLISPLTHPSSRLFMSPDAPLVFYGRYNQHLIGHKPSVAVVGSRTASPDAINLTKKLAKVLAEHHITVISGGAQGIDQAAHEAALAQGGSTVMVLGTVCHAKPIMHQEGLAYVYPFGPLTPKGKFMFVERNRYVASLADAVVIMQGKQGSGTLHTARFAHDLKIPIYAVPGAPTDPRSYVANHLLHHQKARVLVDFSHFAGQFGAVKEVSHTQAATKEQHSETKTNPDLPYLLQLIHQHDDVLTLDEIIALTGKPLLELQKELLEYELAGQLIKQGGQFVLTGN